MSHAQPWEILYLRMLRGSSLCPPLPRIAQISSCMSIFHSSSCGISEILTSCFKMYLNLPFGLATIPGVFTKLLGPVAAHLHVQGCLMYQYMDHIFHHCSCSGFLSPGMSHSRHQSPSSLHSGVHCQPCEFSPQSLSGDAPLRSHE